MAYEIEAIEGRAGTGKTYYAVYRLFRRRMRDPGLPIWSNMASLMFPFGDPPRIVRSLDECFDLRDGVLFIDEAHLWMPARQWRDRSEEYVAWISQNRKRHLKILYTSQAIKSVDITCRDRTQYTYTMSSMLKLGYFLAQYHVGTDINNAVGPPKIVPFNRLIANCYDTDLEIGSAAEINV